MERTENSQCVLILLTSFKRSTIMPHIDIKCFPRELDEQQKAALAADITDVIIRHLNSKDSSISIALQQIQPESWQAIWDAEIAPQMEALIKKPGYSM
ncbi:putative tautomerase ydcE (modular protein) [Escherichia coli 55989]|uniref:Tautomerase PptA n=2 Tax=Gammaproteobacteria TaxID=1236 RepID=B7L7G2_ECO55|nr:putative tautomerase ydcE (modular protein) [Escherichia coli IAI1]CAU97448.1 putative tautomerase ydcE (modular protein) [Escherichia coli 55989]